MADSGNTLKQAQQALARGDAARARELAGMLLAADPRSAAALALLANAANALGDFAAAAGALERLCRLLPADAALRGAHALALNNFGSLLYRDGKLDAAAARYRAALELEPDHVLALTNLAACAEGMRLHAEAARCHERLMRLQPDSVSAALGRSRALRALGADGDADAALREAGRRASSQADRDEIGKEFLRAGDRAAAMRLFGDDTTRDDAALAAIARLQALCNDRDGAQARHATLARRAAARGDARAEFRAERDGAIALSRVARDSEALQQARAEYAAAIERFVSRWPPQRLRAAGVTLDDLAGSRFALAYQGGDDRALATRYGDWLASAAATVVPAALPAPHPGVRRVGLVCARWTQGTIAAYFGSWVGALRACGLDVYFFSSGGRDDVVSAALAAQASHAERLPPSLAAAAGRLHEAALDLLIYPEVGLDPATEVLAALRLAPRQWAAWGHPVTTGLPTIDRFVSVASMEPADAAAHYREPLALLPGLGTCYARPQRAAGAARADLALPAGPLYALPHAPVKLHPDGDALLVAIARRDRDARFVLLDDEIPALTRACRARIDAALRAAGLDPARHLLNLPRLPIDGFRRLLACVDVVLDSVHFSGGNTSLDALAQATPVVTIEGQFMRGRQTAAMLRLLDAPATIARDVDDAAMIATRLAHARSERAALAGRIEANAALLFDRREPLLALLEWLGR